MSDWSDRTWMLDGLRPPEFADAAWHEAGHAVTRLALGFEIEEIWVTELPSQDGNPHRGETVAKANAFLYGLRDGNPAEYERRLRLAKLAGDLVDERRHVQHAAHKVEVLLALGGVQTFDTELLRNAELLEAFERWCAEARRLVDRHWLGIERLAARLIASPDHRLRDLGGRDLVDLERK